MFLFAFRFILLLHVVLDPPLRLLSHFAHCLFGSILRLELQLLLKKPLNFPRLFVRLQRLPNCEPNHVCRAILDRQIDVLRPNVSSKLKHQIPLRILLQQSLQGGFALFYLVVLKLQSAEIGQQLGLLLLRQALHSSVQHVLVGVLRVLVVVLLLPHHQALQELHPAFRALLEFLCE